MDPVFPREPSHIRNQDLIEPPPNDLSSRVPKIAFAAFRYATLTTISISSSYFLGQSFLGRSVIVLLSIGTISSASIYTIHFIRATTEEGVSPDLVRKVDHTARVILWSLLIATTLLTGLAGGSFLRGISFLFTGLKTAEALPVFHGLADITFTLGYAIPITKLLLKNSNFLYERYDNLSTRLQETIQSFGNIDINTRQNFVDVTQIILGRLGFFFGDNLDFDTLMDVAEHLSENTLKEQFVHNLYRLSDKRISEITTRFPNTFTIDFLAKNLSKKQFDAVLESKIASTMTLERIEEISNYLTAANETLTGLEKRKSEDEEHTTLLQEAGDLSETISRYTREVLQFQELVRRLPERPLPARHADWEDRIGNLKGLKGPIENLYKDLTGEQRNQIRPRLQNFLSSVSLKEEPADMEETNDQVLGNYGFRICDFRALGLSLQISADELHSHDVQRTCEYLNERGLSNRREFIQHHILDTPQDNQQLTIDTISRRIVTFCNNEENNPAPSPVQHPLQVENEPQPQAIAPQPRWIFVARTANNLFQTLFSAGLITFQISQQPISTLAGFVICLWRRYHSPELEHLNQRPPSSVSQGFTEAMRRLYIDIFLVSWSIRLSLLGGVISGFYHANTLFHYRQRAQRVHQQ